MQYHVMSGVSLPGLGDNVVQLELDLPHGYRLAWQSLIGGRFWFTLIRSDPALLTHLPGVTSDMACYYSLV